MADTLDKWLDFKRTKAKEIQLTRQLIKTYYSSIETLKRKLWALENMN